MKRRVSQGRLQVTSQSLGSPTDIDKRVAMDVVIGFDPGGQRQFGWAVAELTHQLPLKVLALGCDDHAAGVLASALAVLASVGGSSRR